MSNIPNLNDMLKLYTKKDLWERIQHHIKRIDNLQTQLDQQKAMWKKLKERVCKKFDEEENGKVAVAYRKIYTYMQELEKGEKNEDKNEQI